MWNELNKGLNDGQSTNVTSGFFFGVYTRRGDAGFWSHLQYPKGAYEGEVLKDLRNTLASR